MKGALKGVLEGCLIKWFRPLFVWCNKLSISIGNPPIENPESRNQFHRIPESVTLLQSMEYSITSWHYFPVARTSWSNILPCIFCCPKTSSISVWQLLSKTTFWLILFKNTKWCDNHHSTQGCPSKVKTTSATQNSFNSETFITKKIAFEHLRLPHPNSFFCEKMSFNFLSHFCGKKWGWSKKMRPHFFSSFFVKWDPY